MRHIGLFRHVVVPVCPARTYAIVGSNIEGREYGPGNETARAEIFPLRARRGLARGERAPHGAARPMAAADFSSARETAKVQAMSLPSAWRLIVFPARDGPTAGPIAYERPPGEEAGKGR